MANTSSATPPAEPWSIELGEAAGSWTAVKYASIFGTVVVAAESNATRHRAASAGMPTLTATPIKPGRRVGSQLAGRDSAFRPDPELVSARIGKVQPAPAGEFVGSLQYPAASGGNPLSRCIQILGIQQDQRAAGRARRLGERKPAHLFAVPSTRADPRIIWPIVVENPAEGAGIKSLGFGQIGDA